MFSFCWFSSPRNLKLSFYANTLLKNEHLRCQEWAGPTSPPLTRQIGRLVRHIKQPNYPGGFIGAQHNRNMFRERPTCLYRMLNYLTIEMKCFPDRCQSNWVLQATVAGFVSWLGASHDAAKTNTDIQAFFLFPHFLFISSLAQLMRRPAQPDADCFSGWFTPRRLA